MKKLLTIFDLYNFYEKQNETCHFSAEQEDKQVVVGVPSKIKFAKSEKDIEGLQPVVLQSCHIGENLNQSAITEEAMKKALPSFSNRPILGYIHEVDGQPQFYTHNFHIDDEGEIVYDEYPVGIIPESCNAKLEYDEEKGNSYVVVNGYIFEEYSKAFEILEREQECDVSVELAIRELSYDAKKKVLNLEDFYFTGVTILGCDEDGNKVNPGMAGSNIQLADFSVREDKIDYSQNNKLIETLEKLNATLSSFNIDNTSRKEEDSQVKFEDKIKDLLEKYGKTVDDITFEYDETMSDEEIEALFAEAFGEVNPPEKSDFEEDGEGAEDDAEDGDDGIDAQADPGINTNPSVSDNPPTSDDNDDDRPASKNDDDDAEGESKPLAIEYTVNGSKTFSVTLNEQLMALSTLVNDTYGDTDCDWYSVDADTDKKLVYMYGWYKSYRQAYKVKKDTYSLIGDRVEIMPVYMTADEKDAFDKMTANYSSIEEKLAKYEAEPSKMEVIESEDYSKITDTEEFAQIKADHFDLSVDEIREKLDSTLLKYAKSGKVEFDAKPEKSVGVVQFRAESKKGKSSGRYGNIFNK